MLRAVESRWSTIKLTGKVLGSKSTWYGSGSRVCFKFSPYSMHMRISKKISKGKMLRSFIKYNSLRKFMETSLENLYMYVAARQKLTAIAYSVSKDLPSSLIDIRNFKIQRRERQRQGQKNNWFNKQNNNFASASRFFVHFFPVFARVRLKCLILRFMEDVNKQGRNVISLSELGYGPLKFSFRKVRLQLTK